MVHKIYLKIRQSVTSLIDLIIVFWNRFTSYGGEAHVSGGGRSDYSDGISTIYAFCTSLKFSQSIPECNCYFLSCVGVALEMKLYILFKRNRNKANFPNRICPSPPLLSKLFILLNSGHRARSWMEARPPARGVGSRLRATSEPMCSMSVSLSRPSACHRSLNRIMV